MRRDVSEHHICPRSRVKGEKDKNNTVMLDRDFHDSWHFLFGNMTVWEIYAFIEKIMQPSTYWNRSQLEELRKQIKRETENVEKNNERRVLHEVR